MENKDDIHKHFHISSTQIIAVGFLLLILFGTLLLMLPIATVNGQGASFIDSLFTATTSVCVTGLVVVDTFSYWSVFGQIVIAILIQCGGLGVVTLTTLIMVIIGKKLTLKDRMLIQDAYNLNSMAGLVKFIRKVLIGSGIVEGIGALLYMVEFIPRFGLKGIWISVFNAISAFCNAGMDIVGPTSFAEYVGNPYINVVTMTLIILGGIGFVVWFDVINVFRFNKGIWKSPGRSFRKCSLHTKIVVITTLILLVGGALIIFGMEYNNPDTLGNLSMGDKVLASMFQSTTLRTAGFYTISQAGLHDSTSLICILFMIIGGSPVGTAGGIKTISIALIILTVISVAREDENTVVFKREIPRTLIKKTLAVVSVALFAFITSSVLLCQFNGGNVIDCIFEAASAVGTVGLSRDYTSTLGLAGKIIVICTMYLGRLGPITIALAVSVKHKRKIIMNYSKENVIIG